MARFIEPLDLGTKTVRWPKKWVAGADIPSISARDYDPETNPTGRGVFPGSQVTESFISTWRDRVLKDPDLLQIRRGDDGVTRLYFKASFTDKSATIRRGLPEWLQFDRFLGHIYEPEELDAFFRASEVKRQTPGQPGAAEECQSDALSPSLQPRFEGFYRVGLYPPDAAGKRKAEALKARLVDRAEEGENIRTQVRKVYCKDADPPGTYWTTWVSHVSWMDRAFTFWTQSAGSGVKKDEEGTYRDTEGQSTYEGERRGQTAKSKVGSRDAGTQKWTTLRPGARATVDCPSCNVTVGEPCVTPAGKYTNPHRTRVNVYREKFDSFEAARKDSDKHRRRT